MTDEPKSKGAATSRASLRERFGTFVATLDGFEDVDALMRSDDRPGQKRADYLCWDRRIIIEQKSLETDPTNKPQKFAEKVMEERGILAYGKVSTSGLFSGQQDHDALQHRMIVKIGEVIEDNVEKADKQTRDTREIFSIADAAGIVVLLNQTAAMLDTEIVGYTLNNALQKIRDGTPRYPSNDAFILLSEAHSESFAGYAKVHPIITIVSPHTRHRKLVSQFSHMLQERWAQFNGRPLIRRSSLT